MVQESREAQNIHVYNTVRIKDLIIKKENKALLKVARQSPKPKLILKPFLPVNRLDISAKNNKQHE